MEEVILVNAKDEAIGTMEKLKAHEEGVLHRAFSVLVYNSQGEILLQKRAQGKYHSGGLWTNACCSHPRPDEDCRDAAKRRLIEEIGIDAEPEFLYKFIYKANLDNDLIEHELDHVYTCTSDSAPQLNQHEAEDFKYISLPEMFKDMKNHPEQYTFWFKMISERLERDMLLA